jgi:Holliday junction resolvase-like predicted endonuclease
MSAEVGRKLTSPSRLGDLAEFYAMTWLWDEGFEVFYNAGSTGAVDIIGIKDGEVYLFDVKMNREGKKKGSYAGARTPLQKKLGVQFLLFDPDTRKLRLQKHRV